MRGVASCEDRKANLPMLRALLQTWLQNAAKAKVRETVAQAARGELASAPPPVPAEGPKPCHLGFVFALGIESGCFEDLLQGVLTVRGGGFTIREGGLRGRRIALIIAGPGENNARRAAETLIDGHRPGRVISAGFAGALCPKLKRDDILIADRLLNGDGVELPVELPPGFSAAAEQPGVHRGPLLTTDRVIRLPSQRQALFDRSGALAVDMETLVVAQVCAFRQVAFSSIRVISDAADETLPRDVEHLLTQKTHAARVGAALGAVWRRPASAKDMYQLRENALVASGRLAKFMAEGLSSDRM
jgi:adenosylhomocysteine nucleosidase